MDKERGPDIGKNWVARLSPVAALAAVAAHDLLQRRRSLLRNFPVIGHGRYLVEKIGPELRQYIVAGNDEERPISRDQRRCGSGRLPPEHRRGRSLPPSPQRRRADLPDRLVDSVALPFRAGFARVYATFAERGLQDDVCGVEHPALLDADTVEFLDSGILVR